jgi:orotidine 5'-phosphate decarboxylase subfamily 1
MKEYAIILAADLPTSEDVLSICKSVGPVVDGIKIGVPTVLDAGKAILSRIKDTLQDKPLLLDLKIADIGFFSHGAWSGTNAKIIQGLAATNIDFVTVHGFPGPGSIAEAVESAKNVGIGVLLLPMMSHAGAGLFFERYIMRDDIEREVAQAKLKISIGDFNPSTCIEGILSLGECLNVAGYIGPATRPHELELYRRFTQKPIWCPGFGRQDRQGRSLTQQFIDWAAIVGPNSAAIVGSAIFGASNPLKAAEEIRTMRDEAITAL